MDHIRSYQKIGRIRPMRFDAKVPFLAVSNRKFLFNLEEIELQYNATHGVWLDPTKFGGDGGATTIKVVTM
jgi:hypothetical protein